MADTVETLQRVSIGRALCLLDSVALGRIGFTMDALPAIRAARHLVERGDIIACSHQGSAVARALADKPQVVAYQADAIDPGTHEGWSVTVTGMAELAADPGEIERYWQMMPAWVNDAMSYAIRIRPEVVAGFEFVTTDRA